MQPAPRQEYITFVAAVEADRLPQETSADTQTQRTPVAVDSGLGTLCGAHIGFRTLPGQRYTMAT